MTPRYPRPVRRRRSDRPTAAADDRPSPDPGPAGTLQPVRPEASSAFAAGLSDADLGAELSRRLADGAFAGATWAGALALDLEAATDTDENRFSRARLNGQFTSYVGQFYGEELRGSTFVELGCGGQNPLSVLFMFVLLGARQGIGIDLQPPHDGALAARGLARVAQLLLSDPRLVVGAFPVARAEVAANVGAFDIARLHDGDLGGIDGQRLRLLQADVADTGLAEGTADFVFSTSLLEHVPDVDAVVTEARRITRPGGWGWHVVDGIDHSVYGDPAHPPLGFLEVPQGPPLVNGSNRLRPLEYRERFEDAGFEVHAVYPYSTVAVTEAERAAFAEPWRSMDDETLAVRGALFFVQRRR